MSVVFYTTPEEINDQIGPILSLFLRFVSLFSFSFPFSFFLFFLSLSLTFLFDNSNKEKRGTFLGRIRLHIVLKGPHDAFVSPLFSPPLLLLTTIFTESRHKFLNLEEGIPSMLSEILLLTLASLKVS